MTDNGMLALIPAKGASSRLKRKNLYRLGGKTLLAWAVECAQRAGFDRPVVTTEDEEIAQAAKACGARVPFLRPERLAHDPAGVVEVVLHALDELHALGETYRSVLILLPTSPFRSCTDVTASIDRFAQGDADFLMSVSEYEHTPLAALRRNAEGLLSPLLPQWLGKLGARAQPGELPHTVRANGAVVICNTERLRAEGTYYAYPLASYEMPWERSLDIDTEIDLQFAQFVLDRGIAQLGD